MSSKPWSPRDLTFGLPDANSAEDARDSTPPSLRLVVPVVPLVDSVVLPLSIHPLVMEGSDSARLVRAALEGGSLVGLFMRKGEETISPVETLHTVGTLARLEDVRPSPCVGIEATAAGLQRARLVNLLCSEPFVRAEIEISQEHTGSPDTVSAAAGQVRALYSQLLASDPAAAETLRPVLLATTDPGELAYLAAATVPLGAAVRQAVLDMEDVESRLRYLVPVLRGAYRRIALSGWPFTPSRRSAGGRS